MPNDYIGCWFHKDQAGVPFDGDYKYNKKGKRQFKLESVTGKKMRRTFSSWQAAVKAGWVLNK